MRERKIEDVVEAVSKNGISKRYIPASVGDGEWRVFDQTEAKFVPDEALPYIDPDAKMVIH